MWLKRNTFLIKNIYFIELYCLQNIFGQKQNIFLPYGMQSSFLLHKYKNINIIFNPKKKEKTSYVVIFYGM